MNEGRVLKFNAENIAHSAFNREKTWNHLNSMIVEKIESNIYFCSKDGRLIEAIKTNKGEFGPTVIMSFNRFPKRKLSLVL